MNLADPQLALAVPAVGAVLIALCGRWPNLRETITLTTSVALLVVVASLAQLVFAGERPSVELFTMIPGLTIAFTVEPLGMLFGLIASGLWIVNSIYSIGYMRGNNEKNQTRFYAFFAISLACAMGIAFAGNLLTLLLFYEALTISTYPLVAHKGDANTIRSARVYIGILLTTSIGLLIPAIVWTYLVAGTTDFVPGGILEGNIQGPAVGLLLGLFVFGAG
jgi:multicomponent Na+:H+ antiporter subunit D